MLPGIVCEPPAENIGNGQREPLEDRCIVQQENIRNAKFSLIWENQVMQVTRSYKKVAGLLISWDGKCDDLNTEEEVSI